MENSENQGHISSSSKNEPLEKKRDLKTYSLAQMKFKSQEKNYCLWINIYQIQQVYCTEFCREPLLRIIIVKEVR